METTIDTGTAIKYNRLILNFEGENNFTLPNYHLSWDLLIPVVRLIKERQFFGTQYIIDNIDNDLVNLNIFNLYIDCIEFITEYNKTQTSK